MQNPPAPGQVQCGDWQGGTQAYRAQAMAVPLTDCDPQQPVADWLTAQQQRWPDWDGTGVGSSTWQGLRWSRI